MAALLVFSFLCIVGEGLGCGFPWGTKDCSLITQDYAVISGHQIDKCLSVGGRLFDGNTSDTGVVNGQVRYQSAQPKKGKWNFKRGFSVGPSRFDFKQFANIARTAQAKQSGKYKVVVVTQGGTYNMYNFLPLSSSAQDNGRTLVVFNTNDPIVLTQTPDGKAFGPSVLAPFSQVTLMPNAGYIDGCLIANQFVGSGPGSKKLRMHGNCYQGPISCSSARQASCSRWETDRKFYTCATVPTCCKGYVGEGVNSTAVQCVPTTFDNSVKCAQVALPSSNGGGFAWWKGLLIGMGSLVGAAALGGGVAVAVKKSQMGQIQMPFSNPGSSLSSGAGALSSVTPPGYGNGIQTTYNGGITMTSSGPVPGKMLRRWDSDALQKIGDVDGANAFQRGQAFAANWFLPILTFMVLLGVVSLAMGIYKVQNTWRRRRISAENEEVALE